jgi:hypothetical protein
MSANYALYRELLIVGEVFPVDTFGNIQTGKLFIGGFPNVELAIYKYI